MAKRLDVARPNRLFVRLTVSAAEAPLSQMGTVFGPYLLWPNGWMIKMSLDMEVGLCPGDFVLDGDPAPFAKGGEAPN